MTNDEINKRVAELRGWEFLPGNNGLMAGDKWFRDNDEMTETPPYTTSSELMLELMVAEDIGLWRHRKGWAAKRQNDETFMFKWQGVSGTPPLAVALAYLEAKGEYGK